MSGARLFWTTEFAAWDVPWNPPAAYIGCSDETGGNVWIEEYWPITKFVGMAVYDFRVTGRLELILSLRGSGGWEVRDVNTGAITDTIPNMPEADLFTGPLFSPTQRDLFYLADSGLYVWGVHDWPPPDEDSLDTPTTDPHIAAFPNPFVTTVHLGWRGAGQLSTLDIFNILGQRIRSYDLAATSGPRPSVEWDATDKSGRNVPSGLYFARLSGSGSQVVTKLVLIK